VVLKLDGVDKNENEDSAVLHGLQAEKLQHDEGQKGASRQDGSQKILPHLQHPYAAQGNEITRPQTRGDICQLSKLADKFKTFYTNIKAEFKKIIWPKRDELVKETFVVIVICFIFGLVIFGMDTILAAALKLVAGAI